VGAAVGVSDGDAVAGGDGAALGVVVTLGLAGTEVIVGDGVDVAETGGGAHASTNEAARAMRSGPVTERRVLWSPTAARSVSGR
jgi:hypothetical protein